MRDDVATVANLLADEMRLLEDRDMGRETASAGRWGYSSRHLLVWRPRAKAATASGQVRTILQHAWAEFEHDIRYKGRCREDVPDLDRRFALAAGLLRAGRQRFSAIRDRLRSTAPVERTSQDADTADPGSPPPVWRTHLGN